MTQDIAAAALRAFDADITRQLETCDPKEVDRHAAMAKAVEVATAIFAAILRDNLLRPMAEQLRAEIHDINEAERNLRMEAAK